MQQSAQVQRPRFTPGLCFLSWSFTGCWYMLYHYFFLGRYGQLGFSVIKALISCVLIFHTDCLLCKALCIYTWIQVWCGFCSLFMKILVVYHPAWPPVVLAGLCYDCLVGHQFWHSHWVLGGQCCSTDGKALCPYGYVCLV